MSTLSSFARSALLLPFPLALFACGEPAKDPSTTSASGGGTAPPASGPAATQEPPNTATGPFDRVAARNALYAIDLSKCYELPPSLEQNLHITLTVMPNGVVSEATADPPYGGTDAGNCAVNLIKTVRIPGWIGPPQQMGRTVPHAPIRGNAQDPPYDSHQVQGIAEAQDLSECIGQWGSADDKGKANIAVNPNGSVRSVVVDPPLGGTPRGECIARVLRGIQFKAYSGDPAPGTVIQFDINPKKKK
jgi:hypothetical protein